MSPYRLAARIDLIYRLFGVGLAVEMMARGVMTVAASIGRDTAFQVAANTSLPFTLIGGAAILICHIAHDEHPWRYWVGFVGHFLGLLWSFVFGGAILYGWATGASSGITGPVFILVAGIHAAFLYTSGKGAKWTHKQLS